MMVDDFFDVVGCANKGSNNLDVGMVVEILTSDYGGQYAGCYGTIIRVLGGVSEEDNVYEVVFLADGNHEETMMFGSDELQRVYGG
jgi:hypothetical protein